MVSQVDASTVSAGTLFSESKFFVPDYQRRYSWLPKTQIDEFWADLSDGVDDAEYFLGLIILADGPGRQEIVDGQQRLVTLTILTNALRLIALMHGRRLVAESLRTDFLYAMNFETEAQVTRIQLTDPADSSDLRTLLEAESIRAIDDEANSPIYDAHRRLWGHLEADLSKHENPALRVGQWSEFVTKRLTFAVFKHPDRGAAFRVFEVINTRGKILTPTELIKSHLIGTSSDHRDETYRRWTEIENQLDSTGQLDQLTTFVRHVVSLDHGYVIPRDLYDVVSKRYSGLRGVESLLASLESFLPTYLQMLDPGIDLESTEMQMRAFSLADALSMSRFRPLFLAASCEPNADELYRAIVDIVVPGTLAGTFGTGSIEAQFTRAARRLRQGASWDAELKKLGDLRPPRAEFELRLLRGLNRSQAHVVRSALLQNDPAPILMGFPHLVRPKNAENWPGFSEERFDQVGTTIGNWVLTTMERRPPGARTPEGVKQKITSKVLECEISPNIDEWTADAVESRSADVSNSLPELWYGH
ncbi:DUF262 domain-containing protein [Microbacterium marmarense]|uniref:DUF262 domain-containing protein n=1 Tax=Microbacterium marmarense TaxID=3122051 RepID=A0ABU8LQT4_9MICO